MKINKKNIRNGLIGLSALLYSALPSGGAFAQNSAKQFEDKLVRYCEGAIATSAMPYNDINRDKAHKVFTFYKLKVPEFAEHVIPSKVGAKFENYPYMIFANVEVKKENGNIENCIMPFPTYDHHDKRLNDVFENIRTQLLDMEDDVVIRYSLGDFSNPKSNVSPFEKTIGFFGAYFMGSGENYDETVEVRMNGKYKCSDIGSRYFASNGNKIGIRRFNQNINKALKQVK